MNVLNLKELTTLVRSKADLEKSDFVTDEEIRGYLNLAYTHIYNAIVDTNQDFFINSFSFKASEHAMQVPVDFYKMRALDYYIWDKYFVSARPVGFNERQLEQSDFFRPYLFSDRYSDPIKYNLRGRELKVYVDGRWSGDLTFVIWYIPKPQKVGEGAELPFGWERYLIHSACLDVRNKQDTSTREFERLALRDKEDILNSCQRKDFNSNAEIQDVYGEEGDELYENQELYLSEFVGDSTDNVLPPSLGNKSYLPQILTDFKVDKTKVVHNVPKGAAVVGMQLPDGMSSDFGSWCIVFMFKDSGNVYLTQRSNPDHLDLQSAWDSMPGVMNIDAQFYEDLDDFYGFRKLYYTDNLAYDANIEDPASPPPSSLFSASRRVGLLAYWTSIPSGIQARQTTELAYENRNENTQPIPPSDEDAYLILAIRATRDPVAIYFDNSPINQLGAFEKQGEQGGIRYFISLNSFDHNALAELVKVVI